MGWRNTGSRPFQILTRLRNENVRRHGKRQVHWWTPPIGSGYGGQTAIALLRMWSNITTVGPWPTMPGGG